MEPPILRRNCPPLVPGGQSDAPRRCKGLVPAPLALQAGEYEAPPCLGSDGLRVLVGKGGLHIGLRERRHRLTG